MSCRVELCSEVRLHVESIRSAAGYGTLEEGEEEKACWGTTPLGIIPPAIAPPEQRQAVKESYGRVQDVLLGGCTEQFH